MGILALLLICLFIGYFYKVILSLILFVLISVAYIFIMPFCYLMGYRPTKNEVK